MKQYLFLLGKSTQLCKSELDFELSKFKVTSTKITNDIYQASISSQAMLDYLSSKLGGTVKISQILNTNSTTPVEEISESLLLQEEKTSFAIIGSSDKNINIKVKNALKESRRVTRFAPEQNLYQTAASLKKNYHEYWLTSFQDQIILSKVVWMQNIKEWTIRDLDRPRCDPKSGMLPPKIARIMVNLSISSKDQSARIYDPFCGSGTILAEALYLRHNVIGSDISQKAVLDTEDNLNWLKNIYNLESNFKVFLKDAAHVTLGDVDGEVDSIVFEPYMGPPHIKPEKIHNLTKGLKKLYLGSIKNLSKLQKEGGRLVCILPTLKSADIVKRTDSLIDSCENFGYTLQAGPLEYSRPYATVIRRIYVLEKINKDKYVKS